MAIFNIARLTRANSPVVQTVRLNAGIFTASQTKDVTLTWPSPYPDLNYTVVTDLVENAGAGTANIDGKRQVISKSTTSIVVKVSAGTVGYADGECLIHAIAIHD